MNDLMKNKLIIFILSIGLFMSLNSFGQAGYDLTTNVINTNYGTALGTQTTVNGYAGFASGINSISNGVYSSAFGRAIANGSYSIAMGMFAETHQDYSFSLGHKAYTDGLYSFAFGNRIKAEADNAMIIGKSITVFYLFKNTIPNSLMIGFNSLSPAMIVRSSDNPPETGKVGIGIINPLAKLHVDGSVFLLSDELISSFQILSNGQIPTRRGLSIDNQSFNFYINDQQDDAHFIFLSSARPVNDCILLIDDEANVGIGKHLPESRLHIYETTAIEDMFMIEDEIGRINFKIKKNGFVYARELTIDVEVFPDYVFDDDYKLMSLNDLESYIKENKHLPGIPTEAEVIKNGLNIEKSNIMLLQKIEELTLYLIEIDKEIKVMSNEISKIENKE